MRSKPTIVGFASKIFFSAARVSSKSAALIRRGPLSKRSTAVTEPSGCEVYSFVSVVVPSFVVSFGGSVRTA